MQAPEKTIVMLALAAAFLILSAPPALAYCDGTCENSPCWMIGKQASASGSCSFWEGGTYCCISSGGSIGGVDICTPTNPSCGEPPKLLPKTAQAQENVDWVRPFLEQPSLPDRVESAENCFDYYHFGSVQADVDSDVDTVFAGSPLSMRVKIINQNDYPVVDGAVYIKVFRLQGDTDNWTNGPNVVDQFYAIEGVSLDARKTMDFNLVWDVPFHAKSGRYQASTFFVSQKKFNLLGLSFTDDVVGNAFNFTVRSDRNTSVYLNKNNAKLNATPFRFLNATRVIPKEEPAKIEIELVNETDTWQEILVKWKLYSWDALREENIVEIKEESIIINANEKKKLYYTALDTAEPIYYLVIEARYKDAKSIIGMRFGREAMNRTRINFPAITSYPLEQGRKTTLFSCVHAFGRASIVPNNRLVLELFDANGGKIHSYTYDGNISGAMMAVKDDFAPAGTYTDFTLKASLFRDGKPVESAEMVYDCMKIDPLLCGRSTATTAFPPVQGARTDKGIHAEYIIIVLAGIAVLAWLVSTFRKRKRVVTHSLPIVALALFIFAVPHDALAAKTTALSYTESAELYGYLGGTATGGFWVTKTLVDPVITLWYGTDFIKQVGGEIVIVPDMATGKVNYRYRAIGYDYLDEGSQVPVGTKVKLYDYVGIISWYASQAWVGYAETYWTTDSPYGAWVVDAQMPRDFGCTEKYHVAGPVRLSTNYWVADINLYSTFAVNPPIAQVSYDGSTAGLDCTADNKECTVTSPGKVKATARFPATYGKFYFKEALSTRPGCWGSPGNEPLYWNPTKPTGHEDIFIANKDGLSFRGFQPYVVNFPEATIETEFTVVSAQNPPTTPRVKGTQYTLAGKEEIFTFTSTDPDGDRIKYGIDWDAYDGIDEVHRWLPSSCLDPLECFVDSGAAQSVTKRFSGDYATFKVKALDSTGLESGWAQHTVQVDLPLTADAGPDYTTFVNTPLQLQGTASGGTTPYTNWRWTLSDNTANCAVTASPNTPTPKVTCTQEDTATITLSVTDSTTPTPATDDDTSTITVVPAPSCAITTLESALTGSVVDATVEYFNFINNPFATNDPDTLSCGNGTISNLSCTQLSGNSYPFYGSCTATCTYATGGTYTIQATIKSDPPAQTTTCQASIAVIPEPDPCNAGSVCRPDDEDNGCLPSEMRDAAKPACNDLAGGTVCCKQRPSPVLPFSASAGPDKLIWTGTPVQLEGSAVGGIAPYTYTWRFVDPDTGAAYFPDCTFSYANVATPEATCGTQGIYTTELTAEDLSSPKRIGTDRASVEARRLEIGLANEYRVKREKTISITATVTGTIGTASYAWTGPSGEALIGSGGTPSYLPEGTSISGQYSQILTLTFPKTAEPKDYQIKFTVTDRLGSLSKTVERDAKIIVYDDTCVGQCVQKGTARNCQDAKRENGIGSCTNTTEICCGDPLPTICPDGKACQSSCGANEIEVEKCTIEGTGAVGVCCELMKNSGSPCEAGDYCRFGGECIYPEVLTSKPTRTCNDGAGGNICCTPTGPHISTDLVSIEITTPKKNYGTGEDILPLVTIRKLGPRVGVVSFKLARVLPGKTGEYIGGGSATFLKGAPWTVRLGDSGEFKINTAGAPLPPGNYTLTATITDVRTLTSAMPNDLSDPITFNNNAGTFVTVSTDANAVPEVPSMLAVLLGLLIVAIAGRKLGR